MRTPLIAPSILAADFSQLGAEIKAVTAAGADWIHLDVMDGHFVPNLTFGPPIVKAVRKASTLPFDVHLMITDPDTYAPQFRDAGADLITVHAEASRHLHRTTQIVRDTGARVGVSLNPHTPIAILEHVLDDLDLVLLMTVNPGFGGQNYIKAIETKMRRLRKWIDARSLKVDIEVDGGIKVGSVFRAAQAGANVFVAGSAVFKDGIEKYGENIAALRDQAAAGMAATDGV